MLCDISGSMEPYSRAFIQFLHGTVTTGGAEAFVFATRLTRLTRALSHRQPQVAIDRAAAAAPDWAGGTRIGAALPFCDLVLSGHSLTALHAVADAIAAPKGSR